MYTCFNLHLHLVTTSGTFHFMCIKIKVFLYRHKTLVYIIVLNFTLACDACMLIRYTGDDIFSPAHCLCCCNILIHCSLFFFKRIKCVFLDSTVSRESAIPRNLGF